MFTTKLDSWQGPTIGSCCRRFVVRMLSSAVFSLKSLLWRRGPEDTLRAKGDLTFPFCRTSSTQEARSRVETWVGTQGSNQGSCPHQPAAVTSGVIPGQSQHICLFVTCSAFDRCLCQKCIHHPLVRDFCLKGMPYSHFLFLLIQSLPSLNALLTNSFPPGWIALHPDMP